MFVGPQTQGSTTQTRGTPASVAQSVSDAHGSVTIGQAPPQRLCPGTVQKVPVRQSDCCQQAPLEVSCPPSVGPPPVPPVPLPPAPLPPVALPPEPDPPVPPVPSIDPEQAASGRTVAASTASK
jgi:hypothetical protein